MDQRLCGDSDGQGPRCRVPDARSSPLLPCPTISTIHRETLVARLINNLRFVCQVHVCKKKRRREIDKRPTRFKETGGNRTQPGGEESKQRSQEQQPSREQTLCAKGIPRPFYRPVYVEYLSHALSVKLAATDTLTGQVHLPPDPCTHVSTAGCEQVASRGRGNRDHCRELAWATQQMIWRRRVLRNHLPEFLWP